MSPLLSVVLLAAVGCATVQGTAGPREPQSAGEVRAAITRAWREHLAAARDKDLAGVMAIYAEDVVSVTPGAGEVRGRAALEALEREGLQTHDAFDIEHELHALAVHGDLAHELGTIRGPVAEQGARARIVTWHYMARWRRGPDGAWRLHHVVGDYE